MVCGSCCPQKKKYEDEMRYYKQAIDEYQRVVAQKKQPLLREERSFDPHDSVFENGHLPVGSNTPSGKVITQKKERCTLRRHKHCKTKSKLSK